MVTIVEELTTACPLRLITLDNRGPAAAINSGICAAEYSVICQVDHDVVLAPGWMQTLVAQLQDPGVAAAQGCFVVAEGADLFGRVMAVDLRLRYDAIVGGETDHVCTGNSAYRAEALHQVGCFDERLGYGLDNDMSYRLQAARYRLVFCGSAMSAHHWRAGLTSYTRQQYGLGYGRLDLVAKHPTRLLGDRVSPALMMLHPIVMAAAVVCFAGAGLFAMAGFGGRGVGLLIAGSFAIVGLAVERGMAGTMPRYDSVSLRC